MRLSLKQLDPDGVNLRKRRRLHRRKYVSPGPNFAWHIDGHDKLKPFGFSIHGGIDGFSRKLIWLTVSTTNKMPEVIAKNYLDAVIEHGGIPTKVKADNGTEHSIIEPIHLYFRSLDGTDEDDDFSIISSPQNQRIESYWSILGRDRIGWWRRFFQDLVDTDLLITSDPVVLDCIRFCFMSLIRQDLNSIASEWNTHLISRSKNGGPSGRPNCMFYLNHLYGVDNLLKQIDFDEVQEFYPLVHTNVRDYSEEFEEFAEEIMKQNGITAPENPSDGLHLYVFLLEAIDIYS